MAAYVSKLVLKERINTGEFCFREYEVEVVQGSISELSSPSDMVTLAHSVISLDPSRTNQAVVKKESVAKKVFVK